MSSFCFCLAIQEGCISCAFAGAAGADVGADATFGAPSACGVAGGALNTRFGCLGNGATGLPQPPSFFAGAWKAGGLCLPPPPPAAGAARSNLALLRSSLNLTWLAFDPYFFS